VRTSNACHFSLIVSIVIIRQGTSNRSCPRIVRGIQKTVTLQISHFFHWKLDAQYCSAIACIRTVQYTTIDEHYTSTRTREAPFEGGSRRTRLSAVNEMQDDRFAQKEAVRIQKGRDESLFHQFRPFKGEFRQGTRRRIQTLQLALLYIQHSQTPFDKARQLFTRKLRRCFGRMSIKHTKERPNRTFTVAEHKTHHCVFIWRVR